MRNISFQDAYLKKMDHWTSLMPKEQVQKIIAKRYPGYFDEFVPNFRTLKENISKDPKARDVFINLFHIPVYTTYSLLTESIECLEHEFGSNIIAHGVEEAKGGMYNLLMMCIDGEVRCPAAYWGSFTSNMPNISPLCHGPYYLIYSVNADSATDFPNNPNLSAISHILVPFEENKVILNEKLEDMFLKELVTQDSMEAFKSKLKTYDELLAELRTNSAQHLLSQKQVKHDKLDNHPHIERLENQVNEIKAILNDSKDQLLFKPALPLDEDSKPNVQIFKPK